MHFVRVYISLKSPELYSFLKLDSCLRAIFDWGCGELPEYSWALVLVTLKRQMIICDDEVLQFLNKLGNIYLLL